MSLRPLVLAAVAALALTACGKRGDLAVPPPLGQTAPQAQAEEQAPERAPPTRWGPKPADPATQNSNIRNAPIDGAGRDPRAGRGAPQ